MYLSIPAAAECSVSINHAYMYVAFHNTLLSVNKYFSFALLTYIGMVAAAVNCSVLLHCMVP